MDLILWRHAEAGDGIPDGERPLTKKGHKQAAAMAGWLGEHLPKRVRILVSPAIRAQQTAAALEQPFTTVREIGVGARATAVVDAAGWPDAGDTVVVVGHQPTLGRVAALLLAGAEADWPIKKGAIWWLTRRARDGGEQVLLRAVIGPDLI
jgi:phosphohistidine phosphatase